MKTIWKFPLHGPAQEVAMPLGAKILCVQMQNHEPCLWALVDPDTTERTRRSIVSRGTGHPIDGEPGTYIGTVQMTDGLVFHVFEI